MEDKKDLVRGSLIGGAVGDALGYTVEFDRYAEIISKYGHPGITRYKLRGGVAEISDDTQMTLFTANGMLVGITRWYMRGIGAAPEYYTNVAYKDWYYTQMMTYDDVMNQNKKPRHYRFTWLSAIPTLYARRAPGNTCLTAINDIINERTPKNDSKGCGGVMRVAPYGLFCAVHTVRYTVEEIDVAGGEIARLTHKHPLGWMPAILLTHILYRLVKDMPLNGLDKASARKVFGDVVQEALQLLPQLKVTNNVHEVTWDIEKSLGEVFPEAIERQRELVKQALSLADNSQSDIENIRQLGEGWVGEEALAIAVYAVARHIGSFEETIIAAVNHDGDSDSTGSVAGNIMGAIVGYEAIPQHFKDHLELQDVILAIADDLHQGCIISEYDTKITPEKRQWEERYCTMLPAGIIDVKY